MSIELPHACNEIQSLIDANEIGLIYIEKYREYGIRYRDGGTSYQLINYCPFDGERLPGSLSEEWFDRLESLGLEVEDDLPTDLLTDKWWREGSVGESQKDERGEGL